MLSLLSPPHPFRCPFLPYFFLALFFVKLAFAEVALWKNNASEFRDNGSCLLFDPSMSPSSPKTQYANAPNRFYPCGDPKYELMRQCQMATFYGDKLPEESEVRQTDDGSLLFLVDGCVQCPHGSAEANVQLINNFPSGGWFSGCDEERIVVSSVNITLFASSSRDGVEMDGTFSLGGILRERECGGFLGIGGGREGTFHSLMLEISHNCGRKKAMLLKVKLPKLDVPAIKARGKIAELRGISVDLDISKGGWNVQSVGYEKVRPKQTVPEQPTMNEKNTFGGRQPTETEVQPPAEQTKEQRGEKAEEKHKTDPKNDVQNVSATHQLRPFGPSSSAADEKKCVSSPWSFFPSTFLQFAAFPLFFLLVVLFGCCVRCVLRRRR